MREGLTVVETIVPEGGAGRIFCVFPAGRRPDRAGGIALSERDGAFMLKCLPGVFAAGEMLDWEAPTGGYLLQGAFASGAAAARGVAAWLGWEGRLPPRCA